jgi:hypothetical protein
MRQTLGNKTMPPKQCTVQVNYAENSRLSTETIVRFWWNKLNMIVVTPEIDF